MIRHVLTAACAALPLSLSAPAEAQAPETTPPPLSCAPFTNAPKGMMRSCEDYNASLPRLREECPTSDAAKHCPKMLTGMQQAYQILSAYARNPNASPEEIARGINPRAGQKDRIVLGGPKPSPTAGRDAREAASSEREYAQTTPAPAAQPVSAGSGVKIFGITLGPGGVRQCPIAETLDRPRNLGPGYNPNDVRRKYFVLPRGVRADDIAHLDGKVTTIINYRDGDNRPCFAPRSPGKVEWWEDSKPPHKRRGAVWFPVDAEPIYPEGTRVTVYRNSLGKRNRYDALSAWTYQGKEYVMGVYLSTYGITVQEKVYATLEKKFGAPETKTYKTIVASSGETAESIFATWRTPDLHVEFNGISEGQRREATRFGGGGITIETHEGRRLNKRQAESNRRGSGEVEF